MSSDVEFNATTCLTSTERVQSKLIEAARVKVDKYQIAIKLMLNSIDQNVTEIGIEEQKERAQILRDIGPLAEAWDSYQNLRKAIIDTQVHLSDPDPTLRDMFATESSSLRAELDNLLTTILPKLILPPLSSSTLPTLMSIKAAAGGDEAAIFTEELARMYTMFAEKRGWKVVVMNKVEGSGTQGVTGIRDITMRFEPGSDSGDDQVQEVYGMIKWERGVHRVQRVPVTEKEGRMHSSTVTIVILPIYPETPDEPLFDPKDVKQEVMRARGPGGQHVNRTESAVRLTHLPTGISVSMQDSRSQQQNRIYAWEVLRARLAERKNNEEAETRRANRLSQFKGANRGDKVRTYNFPQDRLTDHRIGFTLNGLQAILDGGDLELVIDALRRDLEQRRLEALLLGEDDIEY